MATAPRNTRDEQMPATEDKPMPFDVTKTPEFQAALNDAVGRALVDALGPLKDQLAAARPGDVVDAGALDSGAENLLQRLAHLIADVGDQGSGRPPRLPPEVLARREESRKRMFASIQSMRDRIKALSDTGRKGEARTATPRYRAMTKMVLNERVIEPFRMDSSTRQPVPVEFYWTGPPNQAMRPINPAALEIFGHYRDWIGGVDTTAAKPGFVSPSGIVILVGERYSPPVSAMQHNGFKPDFGDLEVEEGGGLEADPNFEHGLAVDSSYGSHGVVDPRERKVNVLGTIAAPVIQTSPNDTVRRSV